MLRDYTCTVLALYCAVPEAPTQKQASFVCMYVPPAILQASEVRTKENELTVKRQSDEERHYQLPSDS